jgi:hypothetical protein
MKPRIPENTVRNQINVIFTYSRGWVWVAANMMHSECYNLSAGELFAKALHALCEESVFFLIKASSLRPQNLRFGWPRKKIGQISERAETKTQENPCIRWP